VQGDDAPEALLNSLRFQQDAAVFHRNSPFDLLRGTRRSSRRACLPCEPMRPAKAPRPGAGAAPRSGPVRPGDRPPLLGFFASKPFGGLRDGNVPALLFDPVL